MADKKYKTCTNCKKEYIEDKFYISKNKIFGDGRTPICKLCLKKMINYNNMESIYSVLKSLDIPFIYERWQTALNSKMDTFGRYVSMLNSMPQYEGLSWSSSIFEKDKNNSNNDSSSNGNNANPRITSVSFDLKEKWGDNYNDSQIIKLENFFNDMKQSYKVETASHKDYLYKICKVSLKMDEALDKGEIGEFQKLSSVYDTLMKSAKFTAMQRTAVDDAGGFATFSEFIATLEKEGFIRPEQLTEDFDVVEKTIADINNYTRRLVLGDSSISTMAQDLLLKVQQKIDDSEEEYSDEDDEDISLDEVTPDGN